MVPLADTFFVRGRAVMTWTLVGLNVIVYLWDRMWNPANPSITFADLGIQPHEVLLELTKGNYLPAFISLFTGMFIHANILHIAGNMVYLVVFGKTVETILGSVRFMWLYLVWGFLASLVYILIFPASTIPMIGASGAISGVLGAYILLYPKGRVILIILPFFFFPLSIPAWYMLGLWFLMQVFLPVAGVANWAHVGGFLSGMATVLLMGGARRVFTSFYARTGVEAHEY